MKRFLLMLFLGTNTAMIPNLIVSNHDAAKHENNSILAIKAQKSYQSDDIAIGFNSVIVINNQLYTVDIKNNMLEFYQVINNNLELLATYQVAQTLQLGSVQSYNIDNKIYYEVFIKTDEYNVSSTQYLVLDLTSGKITNLGIFKVAPNTSRYIYDNGSNKVYHYLNYLVFLHSARWYVNSSTTIINLENNEITTINSNDGIYMSFSDGLLFYTSKQGLTALDIINNRFYYLLDDLGQKLYSLYAINKTGYVTSLESSSNTYYLNQIKIVDDHLTLVQLQAIKQENIDDGFYFKNSLYFVGQAYDYTKDVNTIYLYQFANDNLSVLQTYQITSSLTNETPMFYHFHDSYFDIAYESSQLWFLKGLTLQRYDLSSKKQTSKKFSHYYLNDVTFLPNQTLFALTKVAANIISTYIAQYEW